MPTCEACPARCTACTATGCTACKERYELNTKQRTCEPKNSDTIEIDDDHFEGDDRSDEDKIADVIAQLLELTGASADILEWEIRDGKYVIVISFESQAEKDAFEDAVRNGDIDELDFLDIVGLRLDGLSSSTALTLFQTLCILLVAAVFVGISM